MMPSPDDLPSWAALLDAGAATQWWADRRALVEPTALSSQALLTMVGALVRQGQSLLERETELDESCSCQEWPATVGLAWDVLLQAAVRTQMTARQHDGTPSPSGGIVAGALCQQALYDLGVCGSYQDDVASALLRVEAAYAQALPQLFGTRRATTSEQLLALVGLNRAVAGLVWALERRAPWFGVPDSEG